MPEPTASAESIDQVVKDMCANPGRQFSKDTHAQKLYDVIRNTKFPRKIADLFIEITLISTPFTGAHSDDSYESLKELVRESGDIVNNLLHCITQMKDTEHSLTIVNLETGMTTKKVMVSFERQRSLAEKEIEKRGNPEYDIAYYLG